MITDAHIHFESLVFRFLVIPWIQRELDHYRDEVNTFSKRRNNYKLTPHGPPVDLHFRAEDYDVRDFKVRLVTGNHL